MKTIYRIPVWIQHNIGTSKEELKSHTRTRDVVFARFVFMGIARRFGYTYEQIGEVIDRDHTTVIHGLSKGRNNEAITALIEKGYEALKPDNDIEVAGKHGSGFAKTNQKRWAAVYEKYGGRCAICGFADIVEVHHLNSRALGGTDDLNNLILLCPNHHAMIERSMIFIKDVHKSFTENWKAYNNSNEDIFKIES